MKSFSEIVTRWLLLWCSSEMVSFALLCRICLHLSCLPKTTQQTMIDNVSGDCLFSSSILDWNTIYDRGLFIDFPVTSLFHGKLATATWWANHPLEPLCFVFGGQCEALLNKLCFISIGLQSLYLVYLQVKIQRSNTMRKIFVKNRDGRTAEEQARKKEEKEAVGMLLDGVSLST